VTGSAQIGQQRTKLPLRIFVMLLDGEMERVLEQWTSRVASAELHEKFAEEDPRHHPIGFLGDTEFKVRNRVGGLAFSNQCLRQAEPEQFVLGLAIDHRLKVGGAG
jgi:hypothetical protein